MREWIAVACGGMLGALLRYSMAKVLQPAIATWHFPLSTIFVNSIGCFAIGFLGSYSEHIQSLSPNLRAFLWVGFLGSFTTFSAFGYETHNLMRSGHLFVALLNIALQLILCLFAVGFGYYCAKHL